MNIKNKKIVAREFLIFLSMILTGILIILGFHLYNNSVQKDYENLENEIATRKNILKSQENSSANFKIEQQKKFFEKIEQNFDLKDTEYKNYKIVWNSLQRIADNDSIHYRWNNRWTDASINFYKRIGYDNPEEFKDFILQNSLDKSEENHFQKFITEKKELKKVIDQKSELQYKYVGIEDSDFLIPLTIILIIAFFLLRYLFYAIKWSVRMLRV